ncbi:MAG: hypothetical protein IMZ70_08115, partial [Candidatus Atribacteria bacterium]|nr:hypothetical protein [Candidatus Atribacteria bacterium]
DGREFRYAKSTAAGVMIPTMGCNFTDTGLVAYTAFAVAAAVGDLEITIPAATHAATTTDSLKGGYVIVFNGAATNDVTYEITGNDASDANALFKVRLDMPVAVAIVAGTSAAEVYINPWSAIAQANSSVLPRAGVPVVSVSAAANYFWLQTKGIKFINPQTGVGADNGGIECYWRHDGSLQKGETALAVTTAASDTNQPAGIVIAGSKAGNGPLIYLAGY